jgi:transcriptional regulator with XRE-family HTH domain
MISSRKELLNRSGYLLTKYQNEIYRQLAEYQVKNRLTVDELATKLGKPRRYINKILNGNANPSLTELINFSISIGKVPDLEFISQEEYLEKQEQKVKIT